ASIAVKSEAYEQYHADMLAAVDHTVWVTGGCSSWYMDKTGKPNLYPFPPEHYLRDMQNPVFAEYDLQPSVQSAAVTKPAAAA
ncbi:MAG: hypothetical protein AAGF57_17700, partial [Pseudomonadota bacterium]